MGKRSKKWRLCPQSGHALRPKNIHFFLVRILLTRTEEKLPKIAQYKNTKLIIMNIRPCGKLANKLIELWGYDTIYRLLVFMSNAMNLHKFSERWIRKKWYNFHQKNYSDIIPLAIMPEYSYKITQAKIAKEYRPLKIDCVSINIGIQSGNIVINSIRSFSFYKSFVNECKPSKEYWNLMVITFHTSKCLTNVFDSIGITVWVFPLFYTNHHANVTSKFFQIRARTEDINYSILLSEERNKHSLLTTRLSMDLEYDCMKGSIKHTMN